MAQLEHVPQQHHPIDVLQRREQRLAQLAAAQHVGAGEAAEVKVGDDQRAHAPIKASRGGVRAAGGPGRRRKRPCSR